MKPRGRYRRVDVGMERRSIPKLDDPLVAYTADTDRPAAAMRICDRDGEVKTSPETEKAVVARFVC